VMEFEVTMTRAVNCQSVCWWRAYLAEVKRVNPTLYNRIAARERYGVIREILATLVDPFDLIQRFIRGVYTALEPHGMSVANALPMVADASPVHRPRLQVQVQDAPRRKKGLMEAVTGIWARWRHERELAAMARRGEQLLSYGYHGTSLYALEGVGKTNAKLIPSEVAEQFGVPVLTGEGGTNGAWMGKRLVSTTHSYSIARGYAEKYASRYGPEMFDLSTVQQWLAEIEAEAGRLGDKTPFPLQEKRRDLEKLRAFLMQASIADLERLKQLAQIPVVFGVTRAAYEAYDARRRTSDGIVLGRWEMAEHNIPEVDLRDVDHLYVGEPYVATVRKWLTEMGYSHVTVLSSEMVDHLYFSAKPAIRELAQSFIERLRSEEDYNVKFNLEHYGAHKLFFVISDELEAIHGRINSGIGSGAYWRQIQVTLNKALSAWRDLLWPGQSTPFYRGTTAAA
jgi:hypothetical protein